MLIRAPVSSSNYVGKDSKEHAFSGSSYHHGDPDDSKDEPLKPRKVEGLLSDVCTGESTNRGSLR